MTEPLTTEPTPGTAAEQTSASTPWRHRARRPLPGLLQDSRMWFLPTFLVGVAFLAGLGVVVSEPAWWARAAGGGVSLLSVAIVVWVVLYLRRPVVDDRWDPDARWVRTAVEGWSQDLARHGYVDIARSPWRVLGVSLVLLAVLGGSLALLVAASDPVGRLIGAGCLVTLVPLGLVPQLEFATAHGPAVHVDGRGLSLARWGGLDIPWTDLLGVDMRVTRSSKSVVVLVTAEFYASYQAGRPLPLRAIDHVFRRSSGGPAFTIPLTVAARAFPLALWLDAETQARRAAFRQNDQPAG